MVLIFCSMETLFIPYKQSELPFMVPYHWFLFQPKLCTASSILVKYFFCHPVKYSLALDASTGEVWFYDID